MLNNAATVYLYSSCIYGNSAQRRLWQINSIAWASLQPGLLYDETKAIENSLGLKFRNYAIIADEAHSSQVGSTARKLKEVLMLNGEADDTELTSEDMLSATLEARQNMSNLTFLVFTAKPKSKTLELFGRSPDQSLPPSSSNKPEAWHVYVSVEDACFNHGLPGPA